MRKLAAWAVAILGALAGDAAAGRTHYGWLYGTEVMPERGAEIQTWVAETNARGDLDRSESLLWWGPLVGVTDRLELALPVEATWAEADGVEPDFTFSRWGVEARYRFVSQDPEEAPPFAPLVRIGLKREVGVRDAARPELDLVLSYEAGRVHALVDLGIVGEITRDDARFEVRPGAGVSIETIDDLRVGAEAYAELDLDDSDRSWAAIGPNIAWSHGRFWASAALGIGIYQIRTAPRVMWGIAF